jgi:hypothetical protein
MKVNFTVQEWIALYPLYSMGVKTTGDWVEGIDYVYESLTPRQYNFIVDFAAWIDKGGEYGESDFRGIGSGNYVQRFEQYKYAVEEQPKVDAELEAAGIA